jgi:two-component system LytT family response regulator
MPPKTGFDFISSIGKINFELIFTTSFEEYALKAFKVSAVDYLLKPFDEEDLSTALQKFEGKISRDQSRENIETLLHNLNDISFANKKIALPVMSGFLIVRVGDIIRCEADDMYTTFYMVNGNHVIVSKNIKECEGMLEDFGFFRTHISNMINMEHVTQYFRGDGGQVKMTDGCLLEVSRRKKDAFLRLFKKL